MTSTDTAYIEAVAFREGLKTKTVDELLDDYGMFIRGQGHQVDEIIAIRHEIKERAHEAPRRF